MKLLSDEYRLKLVTKIYLAGSREEVKRLISITETSLEQNKINRHIIAGFVERTLIELASLSPMNMDAHEWSNIKYALILLTRIKNRFNTQHK